MAVSDRSFKPGDVLRMLDYPTNPRHYRVWKVTAVLLGGLGQESVYQLTTLDREQNTKGEYLLIPCVLLETCSQVERA